MPLETADVRKRIKDTIERARRNAAERRIRNAQAGEVYQRFLEEALIPLARQVANVLKVEGYTFLVHTPADTLRLASEKSRDDFIEFRLDTAGAHPRLVARIERAKGRETVSDERPVKPGTPLDQLTEQDVLDFLAEALEVFVER